MKIGILCFPGSNCDQDLYRVLQWTQRGERHEMIKGVDLLWHGNSFERRYDIVFLPGGFAYGDYLRAGQLACFSLATQSLREHIRRGGFVVGICNGFQILCEAELLPGCLLRNKKHKHICRNEFLFFSKTHPLHGHLKGMNSCYLPISHSEGFFYAPPEILKKIKNQNQIFCTYQHAPNGSVANIAGVSSADFRILGMMPHPERASRAFPGVKKTMHLHQGSWGTETTTDKTEAAGTIVLNAILHHCSSLAPQTT